MKKIFKYIMLGVVLVGASSCKKYLDINENPNNFTSATPAIVLPQAIVGAASISNTFNLSFADFSGARANAGGFGGFGSVVTYDFGTGDYSGLWTASYDNANDFEYVINSTKSDPTLIWSTSIARIMKAFVFERLVNQFNDVPYTDALKGVTNLQPKYDKGIDVYKASIADINKAIADINTGQANLTTTAEVPKSADPLFGGSTLVVGTTSTKGLGMDFWKKFANTIKLRMLIKMAGVSSLSGYATTEFNAIDATTGFITTDALVQPSYVKTDRPNPTWNSIGFTTAGANTTTSRIPTRWMFTFYTGLKLSDPGRGSVIYRGYPNTTPVNQLGDESSSVPPALSAGSAWTTAGKDDVALGVVKGPTQAQPIMLAAEAWFLRAEAYARGYLTGDAATAFDNGITQSFTYLYKNVSNVVDASKSVSTDVASYKTANIGSPLANFSLAATLDQKIEAIITQKYIALNMIANDENFNEFRRTSYPKIVNGSTVATETFASKQSVSTHADKLPTRVLYPQEEYNLNPANAPAGINKFSSLIFWDLN